MYSNSYYSKIFIKIEFSQQIFDKLPRNNFQKLCPLGAGLFHADARSDRQTDRPN
jgi:hypothetical protein